MSRLKHLTQCICILWIFAFQTCTLIFLQFSLTSAIRKHLSYEKFTFEITVHPIRTINWRKSTRNSLTNFLKVTDSTNAIPDFLWDCSKIHQRTFPWSWALKQKFSVIIDFPAHSVWRPKEAQVMWSPCMPAIPLFSKLLCRLHGSQKGVKGINSDRIFSTLKNCLPRAEQEINYWLFWAWTSCALLNQ